LSLSLRFPHLNPIYTSPLPHTCYMPRQFHSSRFDHPNNIWWEQIVKFLVMYSSLLPYYLVPLKSKYSPQHPILRTPQPTFLASCERSIFISIQKLGKIIFLYILIFIILLTNKKTKDSVPKDSKHSLTSVFS
jgi:hypothetical protein